MKTIINVQFLRATATIVVMATHFSTQYFLMGGSENNGFFSLLHQIGAASVDCFFLISGYIMWISTQNRVIRYPVKSFAYKRITRVFLGYWPYFLLGLLIVAIYPNIVSKQINYWGSFFLTEPDDGKLLIQAAWTLQFEFYFYSIFALLLILPEKHTLKTIYIMAAVVGLAQILAYFPLGETSWQGSLRQNFFLSPFCFEFFAGALIGNYLNSHRIKYTWSLLLMVVALYAFAIYYQQHVIQSRLLQYENVVARVLIYGTAGALMLMALVEFEARGRVLFKKYSILFGDASYSIYLSHTLVIALIYATGSQYWVKQNSQWPGLWSLIFMTITIAYSLIHYRWIEAPLMAVAKYFHQRIFKPKPKPLESTEV